MGKFTPVTKSRSYTLLGFAGVSNFMLTSDGTGRKVADPSNGSFLKKEECKVGNISLLFLLIPALYDTNNIFHLREVFLDIIL